jgi:hypothetical protein
MDDLFEMLFMALGAILFVIAVTILSYYYHGFERAYENMYHLAENRSVSMEEIDIE